MAIWDVATTALNPYLLYVKIGLIVLLILSILGAAWYVKATFAEKDRLLGEKAQLEFSLATEKQRVAVAMEQLKIWQDTVAKMNAAVKNIKIQSDTYITGTENEKAPEFNGRKSIPFIVPSLPASSGMPGYANYSSSRTGSSIKSSGVVSVR